MNTRTPLLWTLAAACLGALMSGYLVWQNYWGPGCRPDAWLSCSSGGAPVLIIGVPTCVYGFGMFVAVALASLIGLARQSRGAWLPTLVILTTVGTLFSLGLSVYELFLRQPTPSKPPACVYGFVFFAASFLAALATEQRSRNAPAKDIARPPQV